MEIDAMSIAERIAAAFDAGIGFIVAGALGGVVWLLRTFFTDRARIDILERDMKAHILRTDEWRHETRDNFDKIDGKLDRIQEALRK